MKKTLTLLLLSVTLLISPILKAADFTFQPRVITGVMSHEYKGLKDSISDTTFFLGAGATLSYDRFFVDTYVQKYREGEDGIYTLTRDKGYAIAFGYAVTDSLSISAGYRTGTTDIDSIDNNGIMEKINFDTTGYFIGAAYGWLIGNGLLGVNFAITQLDGDYNEDVFQNNVFENTSFNGDTLGTTFGVHWKAPITKKLSYGVSLDKYYYSFDFDTSKEGYTNKTVEENFLTLRASLSYRF